MRALIDREPPAALTEAIAASWQSATLGVLDIEMSLSHVPLPAVLMSGWRGVAGNKVLGEQHSLPSIKNRWFMPPGAVGAELSEVP